MLANEYLERIIQHSQQALELLNSNEKRLVVGKIDEIEHDAEAAKWILINSVIDEEGKF